MSLQVTGLSRPLCSLSCRSWLQTGYIRRENGPREALVMGVGDRLGVAVEQVGVHIQGHHRRGVPKHLLHRLDVRASDGVAQIVGLMRGNTAVTGSRSGRAWRSAARAISAAATHRPTAPENHVETPGGLA